MANPWESDPIVQQGGAITATPLPRNPYEVQKDEDETNRKNREEGYDREDRSFDNATKFRNEFRGLPSVAEYNVALGTFNSSMNTQPNAQGDQSLITSYAKMLDPTSAVREGEFATTANTQKFIDQIKAKFAKEFGNGGMLTESGRQAIREEMRNLVVNRFQVPYERDRQQYARFAQMEGLDPYLVVGEDAISSFPSGLLDPPKVEENLTVSTDGREAEKLPQAYQDAHYAYLQQNWGNLDPEAYTAFRTSLDERYGQTPNPDAYRAFVPSANQTAQQGGSPADLGAVPSATRDLGWMEGQLNSAAQTATGAFYANAGNALAGGLPARLTGNQNRLEDIRDINPLPSFAGEFTGGLAGTVGTGYGLGTVAKGMQAGRAANIVGSPATANAFYGTTYGATQDDNTARGAGIGLASALIGNKVGDMIGGAAPQTFNRSGVRAADESVPTVEQLQEQAGNLYRQAEATGATAEPQAVNDMIGRAALILRNEGRMTPADRIVGGGDVANAMRMLGDFADTPMTPTQVGSVRKAIGEGRTAMKDGVPDYNSRRIAGQMLDEFDNWAEPALPGVEEARKVAQRSILGREMERANELATGPQAAQFSQSGEENALRSVYRNLDRQEIKGRNAYPEELTDKIREVSRGTDYSNAMRTLGKFAPNSAVSTIPSLGASGVGASAFGPVGMIAGPAVAATGLFGRKLATNATQRAAKEAELIARGGPEYKALLDEAVEYARRRGSILGGGVLAAPSSNVGR